MRDAVASGLLPSRDVTIEIRRLAPSDERGAAAAAQLVNRELGDGLYRPDRLLADAADDTAAVWLARPEEPVGAAVARLLVPGDATYYQRFGPAATSLFTGLVGSFEAVAVSPAFRRRGLGSSLTEASLRWMRRLGCDTAITLSWRSGREGSSTTLFRGMGFREGSTVERFYFEESVRDGWSCPVCGGPCTCAATLFTLRLGPP